MYEQDLYGFRCECGEVDRLNFFHFSTERKIKCLTCQAEYVKSRRGKYEKSRKV